MASYKICRGHALGIVVGIILLFSSTIAMAQSSAQDPVIQHKNVSIDPMQITSWDKIPNGKIKSSDIEIPIRYIKSKDRIKPGIPVVNIVPKQDIDTAQQILQPTLNQPTLTISWEGLDNWANNNLNGFIVRPPDPIIAAGQNNVGVMFNDVIAFYTKSGSLVTNFPISLSNWYNSTFTSCGTCFISDPRIVYDQNENHWITVVEGINTSTSPWTTNYLLSVSKSDDPNGGWWFYNISGNTPSNTFADYPDLGFDGILSTDPGGSGAIYITSNQFDAAGTTFVTALLTIVNKSDIYNGRKITSLTQLHNFANADGLPSDTLRVATTFGNPGVEYFVNSENDGVNINSYVMLRSIDPRTFTLTEHAVPVGSFNPPPPAQQKGGGGYLLDTIDNRMYNAVYRNGNVYAAFTEANGTVASIRYLQLNATTNKADLDVGYGATGNYYWFPAITTDNLNNIFLVFAYSSSTDYAGIRYTTRNTTGPTEPSAILMPGQIPITGAGSNPERWGDYFGIAKDPSDNSVWIYGEYARDEGFPPNIPTAWDWGTAIAQVAVAAPTPPYSATFNETGIPAGTSWSVIVGGTTYTSSSSSLTVTGLTGTVTYSYSTPVSGAADTRYACSSNCTGTVSSSTTVIASYTTQYQLTMAASPLAAGTTSPVGTSWYNAGSVISISATPNSGYVFSSWSGTGTGSYTGSANPTSITMNSPITETANFLPIPPYSATFAQTGIPLGTSWSVIVGGTTYTSSSSSLTVTGLTGTVTYSYSTPVSGAAGTRYACSSNCTGTVSSSTTVIASYTTQYQLTMAASPLAAGTTSPVGTSWYNAGSVISISATPKSSYVFSSWSGTGTGSYTGSANPTSITMNSPITETANFAKRKHR